MPDPTSLPGPSLKPWRRSRVRVAGSSIPMPSQPVWLCSAEKLDCHRLMTLRTGRPCWPRSGSWVSSAASLPCSVAASGNIRFVSISPIEVRILGSLIEKERTTPEAYPLSTNALLLACNQKSNREPVTDYHLQEIEDTLRNLASKGMVRSGMASGERVVKHRHLLDEVLGVNRRDMAVLAVLMLRGAQTPGELRSRTERYVTFNSVAEVEESLRRLEEHQPPLVRNTGRAPGQSQDRWVDTFSPDPQKLRPRVRVNGRRVDSGARPAARDDTPLEEQLQRLQAEIDFLYEHLDLQKPESD